MARNERYAFGLGRPDERTPWTVQFLEQITSAETQQRAALLENQVLPVVFGPWYVLTFRLSELIDQPEFTILDIKNLTEDSQRRVRVDFEYYRDFGAGRILRFTNAHFICDPARHWTVVYFQCETSRNGKPRDGRYQVSVESQDTPFGLPITKKHVLLLTSPIPDPDDVVNTIETAVTLRDRTVDRDMFYLSHYGLDEPTFESRAWWRSPVVLLLTGLVLFTTGTVLVRRRRNADR